MNARSFTNRRFQHLDGKKVSMLKILQYARQDYIIENRSRRGRPGHIF
jgi:hypothetical protein